MGWERKRGKIEEFNRLLRGATDTSFTMQVGELGDPARRCATASRSTPTRGCRATRAKTAGRHHRAPAEPARASTPRLGRVTEGYGILQPRVSVTMASAAGSLFARIYAGHTGVDPYTTAVSDTYQDLFDEGIFTGKGLYDVDAFIAALDGRVPENALLSHDLFEGLYARTGAGHRRRGRRRLSVERPRARAAPAPLGARRLADPRAGCFRSCPTRAGLAAQPAAARSSRWKILDNLRRSLIAPATRRRCCSLGWTVLPGTPAGLDRGDLALARVPAAVALGCSRLSPGPTRGTSRARLPARRRRGSANGRGAGRRCSSTFLANHAYEMAARDRRDARAAGASRSGACSNGRRPRRAPHRGGAPSGRRVFMPRHDREPAIAVAGALARRR